MSVFKHFGVTSLVLLGVSSMAFGSRVGFDIGMPTAIKGYRHNGFVVGGLASFDVMPDLRVEAGVGYLHFDDSGKMGNYFQTSVLGAYNVYRFHEKLSVEGILGVEGNGFSRHGVAFGAGVRYPAGRTEIAGRFIYNTNEDMFFKFQLTNPVDFSNLFGKRQAEKSVETVPVEAPVVAVVAEPEVKVVPQAPKQEVLIEDIQFKDIAGHWAKPQIEWLTRRGIFQPSDKFVPGAAMNRFSAESLVNKISAYVGGSTSFVKAQQIDMVVSKKELTTKVLSALLTASGVSNPSPEQVITYGKTLGLPEEWLTQSTKGINRAEAAVIVSKVLQAYQKR